MKLRHKIFFITTGLIALIILLAILWFNYQDSIESLLNYTFDRHTLIDLLRHREKHNAVLFMAIIAIGSAIPGVPIAAIAILSGVLFGRWFGFGINILGIVVGNLLAINILGAFPHKVKPGRFRYLADRLKNMHHPRIGLVIGYAVPMLPTLLVNYAALEMKTSLKNKIICILIGSLPVSFLYAFGGDELIFGNIKSVVIALIILLLLFGLYEIIRRDQKIITEKSTN